MSILDRLFGRTPEPAGGSRRPSEPGRSRNPDQVAIERYRYLLRTAPPDELERAHVEAFERLTPEQRAIVRGGLAAAVHASEAPGSDDARDLARVATRAELRQPGTLERTFGASQVPGMSGSFLHTFAAVFVATSMAQWLFGSVGDPAAETSVADDAESDAGGSEVTDGGSDAGDLGSDVGGDFGGDFSDFGGDLGGFDI